ncbi:hypothetical protein J5069_02885 [Candidatus Symbiopectobacterium sp. NZEC127]|uniref:hypothetical protein n=1 Tax=Candidatus Symbiopectobacterium sp. NZEC127 TaxID=2820472 RepID=UPI002227EA4A|nr:hypothetical protein [Candidatus Symbiopectobacterium sp. NZEC127]MCW2484836.1 hypothetical protein [Candidatus Symbiopectobacterium sp. NZEC127]
MSAAIFICGIYATFGNELFGVMTNVETVRFLFSGYASEKQILGISVLTIIFGVVKILFAWAAGMLLIYRYKRFGTMPFPSKSEKR